MERLDPAKSRSSMPEEYGRRSRFLASLVLKHGRPPVLDIGAGSGGIRDRLRGWAYTGLDRKGDPGNNVVAYDLDASEGRLPFEDGSFGTVIAADIFEHILLPDRLLEEIRRVLKPDGAAILSFPNERGVKGRLDALISGSIQAPKAWAAQKDGSYHIWYFTPEIAREFIGGRLKVVASYPYWGSVLSKVPLLPLFPMTSTCTVLVCWRPP